MDYIYLYLPYWKLNMRTHKHMFHQPTEPWHHHTSGSLRKTPLHTCKRVTARRQIISWHYFQYSFDAVKPLKMFQRPVTLRWLSIISLEMWEMLENGDMYVLVGKEKWQQQQQNDSWRKIGKKMTKNRTLERLTFRKVEQQQQQNAKEELEVHGISGDKQKTWLKGRGTKGKLGRASTEPGCSAWPPSYCGF